MEYSLLNAYYYNLLLWFPFYFTFIHYDQYATYLSILSPICSVIGSYFYQHLIGLCPTFTHWITTLFCLLATIIHFILTEVNRADESGSVGLYFILITVVSLIIAGPLTEIGMYEFKA